MKIFITEPLCFNPMRKEKWFMPYVGPAELEIIDSDNTENENYDYKLTFPVKVYGYNFIFLYSSEKDNLKYIVVEDGK